MSRNVKIEPDWCVDWHTECVVREAAECAGLYEGHQVKDEVVVGPEVLQPRDVAYCYAMSRNVKIEPDWCVDWHTECGVSEAAECAGLYEGHQVKDEVVVGPEVLQPRDVAYSYSYEDALPEDAFVKTETPHAQIKNVGITQLYQRHPIKDEPPGLYEGQKDNRKLGPDPTVPQLSKVASTNEPRHLVPCKQETPSATNYPDRKPLSSFNVRPECITQDRMQSSDFDTLHRQAEDDFETNEEIDENNHRVAKKKNYICNTCSKNFFQRKAFIEHIKIHKVQNHAYGKKFSVKKSLKQHGILTQQQPVHKNNNPKKTCKICNKTYNRNYIYRHRLIHTDEKPFSCDTCDQQFRFKDALIKHLQTHSGKPLTCHVCRKAYTSAGSFWSHIKTHKNKFKCEICDKTLSRHRYLIAHYALHTGEKKFKCEICGTNFVTKRQLSYHQLVHSEKKTFCCDVCGKQLSDKSYLARHLRRHAGYNPKPHVCDICGFKFTTTTRLTIHKRKHTGEKPFSCKICAKQYRHKSTLTGHMRGHTRDNQ